MSTGFASALLMLVGAQLALQAPVNNRLSRFVGKVSATAVNFAVGTLAVGLAALLAGHIESLSGVADAPPYQLLGGAIGAFFVLTAVLVVETIGAGTVAAATITGQLIASLAVDQAGILDLAGKPLTPARIVGAVALIAGTLLIARRREGPHEGADASKHGFWFGAVAVGAMALSSSLVSIQAPINAQLADRIGSLDASLVNFTVGLLLLLAIVAGTGDLRRIANVRRAPGWQMTGGLMGAINATTALILVQDVGAGVITAATVSGQLLSSVAIDRFGILGMRKRLLTPARIGGVLLLTGGVILIAL